MEEPVQGKPDEQELELAEKVRYYRERGLSRRGLVKSIGVGAVLAGTVSAITGCSRGEAQGAVSSAAAEAKGGKPLKMLDVGFGDVVQWCDQIRDATKFWGQFFNIEVTHVDGGAAASTQLARMQDAVNQGPWDFAAACPVQSNTLVGPAKKLIDQGTPVIQQAVDIGKPGEDIGFLTFISQDYVDVGKTLSAYLFEKVGGKGTVIVTQGQAGTGNVIGRAQGVREALKQYPGMELLAEDYTDYSDAESRTLWDSYVQKYPKIDVGVTLTTGTAALNGAYGALKAAGRANKTLLGSNNAEQIACQAVIDGQLAATIRHSSCLLGMWAAVIGASHKTGVTPNVPKTTWMPDQLITDASQAQSMIYLQQNNIFLA